MLSETKFKEGMFLLCEQFQRDASEILLKGYWLVLKDLTDEEFERACLIVLSQTKFHKLPLPAEIREAVFGNVDDRAQVAIAQLEDAMRRYGHVSNLNFADKTIHAVVQAYGGWEKVCAISDEEFKFFRHDFIKSYRALSKLHPAHTDIPAILWGCHGGDTNKKMLEDIGSKAEIISIGFDKGKTKLIESGKENLEKCSGVERFKQQI